MGGTLDVRTLSPDRPNSKRSRTGTGLRSKQADERVPLAQWVDWALQLVEHWPDDVRDAPFNVAAAADGVRLAESVPKILQ
jgi:hypothetical protein